MFSPDYDFVFPADTALWMYFHWIITALWLCPPPPTFAVGWALNINYPVIADYWAYTASQWVHVNPVCPARTAWCCCECQITEVGAISPCASSAASPPSDRSKQLLMSWKVGQATSEPWPRADRLISRLTPAQQAAKWAQALEPTTVQRGVAVDFTRCFTCVFTTDDRTMRRRWMLDLDFVRRRT